MVGGEVETEYNPSNEPVSIIILTISLRKTPFRQSLISLPKHSYNIIGLISHYLIRT